MVNVELKYLVLKRFRSDIDIKNDNQFQFALEIHANANYFDNYTRTETKFTLSVKGSDEENRASIDLEIYAEHACEGVYGNDEKPEAHIKIIKSIFPYARELVSDITAKSGMNPLILDEPVMEEEKVRVTDELIQDPSYLKEY